MGQKLVLDRTDTATALEVAAATKFYSSSGGRSNFGKVDI